MYPGGPCHRRCQRAPAAWRDLLPSSPSLSATRPPGNSQSVVAGCAVFVDLLAFSFSFAVAVISHTDVVGTWQPQGLPLHFPHQRQGTLQCPSTINHEGLPGYLARFW